MGLLACELGDEVVDRMGGGEFEAEEPAGGFGGAVDEGGVFEGVGIDGDDGAGGGRVDVGGGFC